MRSCEELVERLLCAEHCRRFKPWSESAPSCGARDWLRGRAAYEQETIRLLERLRGRRPPASPAFGPLLRRTVCRGCPRAGQCRYPSTPSGHPCGGLVVLELMLEREWISMEELYDPPWCRNSASA
ncbi:MAG: hypothetical protein Kow0092_08040 [Deferrisomatales bacterium]